MPAITSQGFALRSHDPEGAWESNDGRYRVYARQLLAEHERLCTEVLQQWPKGAGPVILKPAQYPEIASLARRQSQTSDTTRIYAAMAVEGYLNFYGVLRLGQQVFDDHFERMGLVPKLRALLLVCDQLNVTTNDPLALLLEKVAQARNSLVHPKAKEVVGDPALAKRTSLPMPETARLAVANMEAFFASFIAAVPRAANHLNRLSDA